MSDYTLYPFFPISFNGAMAIATLIGLIIVLLAIVNWILDSKKRFRERILEAIRSQCEVEIRLKNEGGKPSVIEGLILKHDAAKGTESIVFIRNNKKDGATQMRISFSEILSIRYVNRKIKIV